MKEFPPFRLDPGDQSLWRDGKRVALTPKAYAVLRYLVERAGRLVTQDELLEAVWPSTFVQPEVLKSQILDVRAALGDRPKDPLYIETVPRRGYRFIASVRDAVDAASADAEPAVAASARTRPDRTRIAVLPFVNMSADPDSEYFSDGLTEELINRLACITSLQVVARTSAFRFKGVNEDIRTIGAQLNAGTILEGSVRRSGEQLRVTAQLIDVESGYHLFSRTYQREFRDVFELQDDIAQVVAAEIAPAGESGPLRTATSRTENLGAYNAYLRGMYAMSNRFGDLSLCLDLYREALSLDPAYAPAWAGIADAYFIMAWYYLGPPNEVMPLSKLAALKAHELDPESAQSLVPLAVSDCAGWHWKEAEARFRRAIELRPGYAQAHVWFAFFCLIPERRVGEALAALETAVSLDPLNPMVRAGALYVYGLAGRYEDVRREYSLATKITHHYGPTHVAAGIAYELCGHGAEAIPIYRMGCELSMNVPFAVSCLGHALAKAGEHGEARALIEQLQAAPIRSETDIARVYCGLRDHEKTLESLEAAAESHCLYLLRTVADPRFDWLIGNPRLDAIWKRMGLSAWVHHPMQMS
jgi:TolB-like protein/Flp pilus assembly protein TadD